MPDVTTLGLITEYFLGLYFIGHAIAVTRVAATPPAKSFQISVDWFKLVFGLCLLALSVFGKVL